MYRNAGSTQLNLSIHLSIAFPMFSLPSVSSDHVHDGDVLPAVPPVHDDQLAVADLGHLFLPAVVAEYRFLTLCFAVIVQ